MSKQLDIFLAQLDLMINNLSQHLNLLVNEVQNVHTTLQDIAKHKEQRKSTPTSTRKSKTS